MSAENLPTYGWMGSEDKDKARLCGCFEILETLASFQGQPALQGTILLSKQKHLPLLSILQYCRTRGTCEVKSESDFVLQFTFDIETRLEESFIYTKV